MSVWERMDGSNEEVGIGGGREVDGGKSKKGVEERGRS
jgi:hypothetical protein